MKVLVYAPIACEAGKRLRSLMEELTPEGSEIYHTMDSFRNRLRQPRTEPTVAVLLAISREDLSEIVSLHHLLFDIRIILILPDRETDTISKGHSLRPRFLTYCDADFLEVVAILNKMHKRSQEWLYSSLRLSNSISS